MKKVSFVNFFMKTIVFMMFSVLWVLPAEGFSDFFSGEERTNIRVYEIASPAVVAVDADIKEGVSSGTGLIIDSAGIILTNSHIVDGYKDIKVTLADGQSFKGKLIANNIDKSDFALIKIEPDKALSIIKLGDSSSVQVGQKVLAIGNPFGFDRTLTIGIISRIDLKRNKIQTDAAINPGSSGGPLLNSRGEVIGINQSIYNPDNNKSNIGIGFAVPINIAKEFLNEVKNSNPELFEKN